MPPVVDPGDPAVVKLQDAARSLHARGVNDTLILSFVRAALAPPAPVKLQLPATFTATHQTAGLPNFPAVDCFAPAGRAVGAPDDGQLIWPHLIAWDRAKACGGFTCYYRTDAAVFFLTHFGQVGHRGVYKRGDTLGHVGIVPHGWWASHIHVGRHPGRYTPPEA